MGWVPRKKSLVLRKPEKLRFTEQSYRPRARILPTIYPICDSPTSTWFYFSLQSASFPDTVQEDSVTGKDGFGVRNVVVWGYKASEIGASKAL